MKITCLAVSVVALNIVLATNLHASGSYRSNTPRPPARGEKGERVDWDKYDLGQKVFNGKTPPGRGDAAAQKPRLQAVQAKLPEKVARKKDLTTLAGQLTEEQLQALQYYVEQRYGK